MIDPNFKETTTVLVCDHCRKIGKPAERVFVNAQAIVEGTTDRRMIYFLTNIDPRLDLCKDCGKKLAKELAETVDYYRQPKQPDPLEEGEKKVDLSTPGLADDDHTGRV